MAYFHTNVLDPQIKALPTVSTASGSVATFDTDMTENLISCVSYINATQASGTPTPDNPLLITGYNNCALTVNGNSVVVTLGQYVYGGYIDAVSRHGKLTHQLLTLDGTENITLVGSGTNRRFNLGQYPQYSSFLYSSHFIESVGNSNPWGYYRFVSNNLLLMDNNEQMADVPALQTWLETQYNNDTPVQFLCELETPISFSGISSVTAIPTILGTNTISSNRGDMKEVNYLLSVGEYLRQS